MSRYVSIDFILNETDEFGYENGVLYGLSGNSAPTIDIPQWIPCSERLPKENEEVLVCDEDGTMEVCDLEMFERGRGLKWTDKNGYECWLNVIAWMPLPKPYGEREVE